MEVSFSVKLIKLHHKHPTNLFFAGEDVPVYAIGPNSNLVHGAMEQSFIAYIMSYSGCIGPAAKFNEACKYQSSASTSLQSQMTLLAVLLALLAKLM